jgi:hypothetical protein
MKYEYIYVIKNDMVECTGLEILHKKLVLGWFKKYPKLEGYAIIPNSCIKKIFGNNFNYGRRKIGSPYNDPKNNCWCDICISDRSFRIL